MTHRIVRTALLLIAALLAGTPQPAEAKGWLDHLEQLSGPGPFHGTWPAIAVTVGCFGGREAFFSGTMSFKFTLPESSRAAADPCLYVDYRTLAVDAKDPFPEVTARLLETGLTFHVLPYLEIGGGVGFARFGTRDLAVTRGMPGLEDITTYNLTVTAGRLIFKPLMLSKHVTDHMGLNAGFFYLLAKPTVRFGRLTAAHFGADNGWSTGSEVLWSASAHVDVRMWLEHFFRD